MKRILIANDLLKGGGVENVLESLVRYLMNRGNEITLMIPNCSEHEARSIFGADIKVYPSMRELKDIKKYSLHWFFDRGLYIVQKLFYRIRLSMMGYDVVIALKEGPIMKELARICAKKKYAWVHSDYNMMHWSSYCFRSADHERKCMKQYQNVVCVSRAVMKSVIETIGDPGNLCVKYNPIDFKRIREKAKEPCTVKKETEGLLFVSIGRLAYPKNYALLIDVCNELSKKYFFELWIIGDGPDYQELQKKIDTYEISCIKLLGCQTNPFPYLQQADVFISASLVESYGLAVQEALILGKPVVAVKCPAIEENFSSSFGVLTNSTSQDLKYALKDILVNPKKILAYRNSIKKQYCVEDKFEQRLLEIEKLWEIENGE